MKSRIRLESIEDAAMVMCAVSHELTSVQMVECMNQSEGMLDSHPDMVKLRAVQKRFCEIQLGVIDEFRRLHGTGHCVRHRNHGRLDPNVMSALDQAETSVVRILRSINNRDTLVDLFADTDW